MGAEDTALTRTGVLSELLAGTGVKRVVALAASLSGRRRPLRMMAPPSTKGSASAVGSEHAFTRGVAPPFHYLAGNGKGNAPRVIVGSWQRWHNPLATSCASGGSADA